MPLKSKSWLCSVDGRAGVKRQSAGLNDSDSAAFGGESGRHIAFMTSRRDSVCVPVGVVVKWPLPHLNTHSHAHSQILPRTLSLPFSPLLCFALLWLAGAGELSEWHFLALSGTQRKNDWVIVGGTCLQSLKCKAINQLSFFLRGCVC